jgi:hypothetical protein
MFTYLRPPSLGSFLRRELETIFFYFALKHLFLFRARKKSKAKIDWLLKK